MQKIRLHLDPTHPINPQKIDAAPVVLSQHVLSQLSTSATLTTASQKGKKHDNSLILNEFVRKKRGCHGKYGLHVPRFAGACDDYVKQEAGHQNADIMGKIREKWALLRDLYAGGKEGFFEKSEVLEHFSDIEQFIKTLFDPKGKIPLPDDVLQLIEQAKEKGVQLIVRSSGDEDGDGSKGSQVAPGIHESVPAVGAEPGQVLAAAGVVIASYMRVKAMQAKALDRENPFASLPPWSFKVQEFIGETKEQIPVAVVLATTETLYVEGKTERVTTLNAAVGFGDGVTSGLVAPDAAILLKGKSYYENRDKPVRIVAQNGAIMSIKNEGAMRKARALNEEQLRALYELGQELEGHFGYPLDVELVLRGTDIHFVQARHLVREPQNPTYFKAPPERVKETMVSVSAIPNLAQVSSVTDPSKVLVASSLENALTDYQASAPGTYSHIVVQQMPGEYGHAALFFGALKPPIPVFQLDIEKFGKLKRNCSKGAPLVFDVQNEKVHLLTVPLDPTNIKQGWNNHPTGRKPSLDLPENRLLRIARPSSLPDDVRRNLEKIRSKDRASISGLRKLQRYSTKQIESLDLNGYDAPFYRSVASKIQEVQGEIFRDIEKGIIDPKVPYLERLLDAKMLERLLDQERTSADDVSLSTFSVSSLGKEIALDKPATDYMRAVSGASLAKEANLSRYALTPEGKELYISFLKEIENDPQKEAFQKMVATLERFGAAPLWMNFLLPTLEEQRRRSENEKSVPSKTDFLRYLGSSLLGWNRGKFRLPEILSHFGKQEKALGEQLSPLVAKIDLARRAVPGSTTVKAGEQLWKSIEEVLTSLEKTQDSYESLSPIGKALILQTLHQAIDLADIAIKMGKNLPYESEKEAVLAMKGKVRRFGESVQKWGPHLLDTTVQWINSGRDITFEQYCEKLSSVLARAPNKKESMIPTPGYDARAQVWGSDNVAAGRGLSARSVEDVFTTFHRTMLVCLNRAQKGIASGKSSLVTPPSVQNMKTLLETRHQYLRYQGTAADENGISVHYQLPLNNHGMECTIEYDRHTGKTAFGVTLNGETRGRAPLMQECIELTNLTQERNVIDPPRVEKMAGLFHAKWEVRTPEEAQSLIGEFDLVRSLSWENGGDQFKKTWQREILNASPQVAKERILQICNHVLVSREDSRMLHELFAWLADHHTDPDCREQIFQICRHVREFQVDNPFLYELFDWLANHDSDPDYKGQALQVCKDVQESHNPALYKFFIRLAESPADHEYAVFLDGIGKKTALALKDDLHSGKNIWGSWDTETQILMILSKNRYLQNFFIEEVKESIKSPKPKFWTQRGMPVEIEIVIQERLRSLQEEAPGALDQLFPSLKEEICSPSCAGLSDSRSARALLSFFSAKIEDKELIVKALDACKDKPVIRSKPLTEGLLALVRENKAFQNSPESAKKIADLLGEPQESIFYNDRDKTQREVDSLILMAFLQDTEEARSRTAGYLKTVSELPSWMCGPNFPWLATAVRRERAEAALKILRDRGGYDSAQIDAVCSLMGLPAKT